MIKVKDIRPMFNGVITTADRYEENQKTSSGLVDARKMEGMYKEYQTVVKVGSAVREVKVGDVVLINPSRYVRKKYDSNSLRDDFDANPVMSINIPTVEMDGVDYFLIDDRDILYVIEDWEEDGTEYFEPDSPSELSDKKSPLILPKPAKIELFK